MSAEGESSPSHAVVPTDAPGTASTVDMDTNKHVLNSLNNIDQTMGKMAGLIAKFAGQAAGKGSKRSADPQSDTDESESVIVIHRTTIKAFMHRMTLMMKI